MATKKTIDTVPEATPSRGGSYVREPDGKLTQTEGPDMAQPSGENPVQQPTAPSTKEQ